MKAAMLAGPIKYFNMRINSIPQGRDFKRVVLPSNKAAFT
jgi:hypothetical protein